MSWMLWVVVAWFVYCGLRAIFIAGKAHEMATRDKQAYVAAVNVASVLICSVLIALTVIGGHAS